MGRSSFHHIATYHLLATLLGRLQLPVCGTTAVNRTQRNHGSRLQPCLYSPGQAGAKQEEELMKKDPAQDEEDGPDSVSKERERVLELIR